MGRSPAPRTHHFGLHLDLTRLGLHLPRFHLAGEVRMPRHIRMGGGAGIDVGGQAHLPAPLHLVDGDTAPVRAGYRAGVAGLGTGRVVQVRTLGARLRRIGRRLGLAAEGQ